VEIDEALTAFSNLAQAIDPEALQEALHGGARSVDGRGDDLNRALQATGTLTGNLAAQDRELAGLARDLNRLATSVNSRDEKLTALIGNLSVAGRALSGERGRMKTFLATLDALIRQGGTIVSVYREKLPSTLTEASELVMTLKANSGSLAQGIARLADSVDEVWTAWDRGTGGITVRISLDQTLRTWLEPIFDAMGWGAVPCLDANEPGCDRTLERRGTP
jgi:phospholipid/cholesterol/gamma-HCH transport system substrate-binding protein